MKSDPHEKNLYWRGASAYFRKTLREPDGTKKDHWESLGELAPLDARRIVRGKRKAAELANYAERWGEARMRSDISRFPELFAAYRAFAGGERIKERTVRENIGCLSRVARELAGAEGAEGSLAILDGGAPARFAAGRIRAAKDEAARLGLSAEETKAALDRAETSTFSVLAQARSLFSAAALASEPYKALTLPPKLAEFRAAKVAGTTLKRYRPPPREVVARVIEGIRALRATAPDLWLAAMLEINAGARRLSASEARWDWFVDEGRTCEATGRPLVSFYIGLAKGGESAPAVYRDLHDEMQAARSDLGPFIIPGADAKARDAVFKKLCAHLRTLGLDEATLRRPVKPNHELRKIYLNEMNATHGKDAAMAASGHSSERMLQAYTKHRAAHALRLA